MNKAIYQVQTERLRKHFLSDFNILLLVISLILSSMVGIIMFASGTANAVAPAIVDGSFGQDHACVLTDTGKIYCAGINNEGQLGDGSSKSSSAHKNLVQFDAANPTRVYTQVSAGWRHTCGLATDQKIYCAGEGAHGEQGRSTSADNLSPMEWGFNPSTGMPFNKLFTKVVVSASQTCGLATDSLFYCTGWQKQGEFGVNNTSSSAEYRLPIRWGQGASSVSGKTFTSMSGKSGSLCVLTTDQLIFCSGENGNGEMGDGTSGNIRYTPVPWGTTSSSPSKNELYTQVSASTRTTCGLTTTQKVYCSGSGSNGELATGGTSNSKIPVLSGGALGKLFTKLAATDSANCAMTTDQLSYCAGRNGQGQFGIGNTTNQKNFTAYGGSSFGTSANLIASGARVDGGNEKGFVCAIKTVDQTVWCSGGNNYGQFGNGTSTSSSITTPVKAFTTLPL